MAQKRLFILAPVMPQSADITGMAESLSFLAPHYQLDWHDPLAEMDITLPNDVYYHHWQEKLLGLLPHYAGFIGFSFGGVILQQCLPLLVKKQLILFSTPTFADTPLTEKLSRVIDLCRQHQLIAALENLYRDVYFPNSLPVTEWDIRDAAQAEHRLMTGLTKVLTTDSTKLITTSKANYLHFIGGQSHLVNRRNVLAPPHGQLIIVPGASMRVLQDNLPFCKKIILEKLDYDAE
ncbi:hypothetical protein DIZ81_11465 [Legionella taurinensis]|uniref:Alpha/beta hydrolase n=1 Tax=Legionella taurinensis TaxID=70611 RepID=A0A3A5L710_9GAMM|nr:hypothetical protein [Legionella taurinensis]MDX1838577.1 hypothetical protein [Legionella taurinensis]PUT39022.1 hypothetical protein DB744_11475 [Legionella taurinensis]PUT41109.1 hypothetical protein DB746_09865 [Legionella taurinensis]PUT43484.1 hypothetical protein DB743_10870 [Legionella taurinensis]PUT46501.1 hypothetical protein DB745_10355 [Legionella taurinensis]